MRTPAGRREHPEGAGAVPQDTGGEDEAGDREDLCAAGREQAVVSPSGV